MYYKNCPNCGANLDPGEVCDCEQKERAVTEEAVTAQTHNSPGKNYLQYKFISF